MMYREYERSQIAATSLVDIIKYIAVIILLLLASIGLKAQTPYYYCHFEVLNKKIVGDEVVAILKLKPLGWKPTVASKGHLIPLYEEGKYETAEPIGELEVRENLYSAIFKAPLADFDEELLSPDKAILQAGGTYKLDCIHADSPVAQMRKLAIKMIDAYEEKDLLNIPLDCKMVSEQTELILQEMASESAFVAKAMRDQMEEPMIKGGPWDGQGLFDVMEEAEPWMVRQFLTYVNFRPLKYQGKEWKFSEVFATWLVNTAPVPLLGLEEFVENEWKANEDVPDYLRNRETDDVEVLLESMESKAGYLIDAEAWEEANTMIQKATQLSKAYDDTRLGWIQYRRAKWLAHQEKTDAAIDEYESAAAYMEKIDALAGKILVYIDLGHTLVKTENKKHTKKAIDVLEEVIQLSAPFPKDDETLGPMQALAYRNLGDAYLQLGKKKAALEAYEKGLECTTPHTPIALKRRATLHFRLAEWAEKYGKDKQQVDYHNAEAVKAYKEYEALSQAEQSL